MVHWQFYHYIYTATRVTTQTPAESGREQICRCL